MKIRVLIDNNRARFQDLTDDQRRTLTKTLSYSVPRAHFSSAFRSGQWDGRKKLFSRDGCSVRLFLATRVQLEEDLGCTFRVNLRGIKYLDFSDDETESDREYQNEAVAAMMSTPVGGLILAATGSGKTYTSAMYFRKFHNPAIFVVDELTLMYQTQKELALHLGEPVGMIGHGKWEPQRVTVVMIQSLQAAKTSKKHKRQKLYREWVKTIDVVVIDEFHLQMNKRNFKVLQDIKPLARFGLTATLEMNKKDIRMIAWDTCGPMLYEFPLEQGRKEGYLSTGVVFRIPYISEGLSHSGQYFELYNDLIVNNDARNDKIIGLAKHAIARGHRVIIAVDMPEHVDLLSKRAHRAGLSHQSISGRVAALYRRAYCQQLEDGDVPMLIVNRVFKKGINLKTITFMIDGAGLGNRNDALQKYGRGVRTSEGKTGLIYVDINDQLSRAGVQNSRYNPFVKNSLMRVSAYKKAGIHCVIVKHGQEVGEQMIVNMEDRLEAAVTGAV